MKTKLHLMILVGALALFACHRKTRVEPTNSVREMVGLYEMGYEPSGFRICSDTTEWRGVRFLRGVGLAHWPATRTTDRTRVVSRVHWQGEITIPGRPGAIRYPRTVVIVHKILDVRAAQVGECGWDGN